MDPEQPDLDHSVAAIGQLIVVVTAFVWFGHWIVYLYQKRPRPARLAVRRTAKVVSQISVWVIVAVTLIIPIFRIGLETLEWWEWVINAIFIVMIWAGLRARRLESEHSEDQDSLEDPVDGD